MDSITDFVKILELKSYSKSTIDNYHSQLKFLKLHFKKKSLKQISDNELFEFIYHLVNTKKISASYQRQIVGGLKLFYKEIYGRSIPLLINDTIKGNPTAEQHKQREFIKRNKFNGSLNFNSYCDDGVNLILIRR